MALFSLKKPTLYNKRYLIEFKNRPTENIHHIMLKTKRFRDRESELEKALNHKKIESLWNKHIRETLRKQPVSDLHDHFDFHLHRKNRIKAIVSTVLNGHYQPDRPLRIRSEKNLGMSRHLVFLNPEDAIVLESVAAYLMPIIKAAQPCDNAFFSRNHHQPKGPEDVDDTFAYPWWLLWPEFQKRILKFAEEREYTVVTDVATYYDTIDFIRLRNYISSLGNFSEIFLDFIFFVFERFVWRPDYLPFPGKGLPQINLDAPRLVAHAFLFEVDRHLNKITNGDFVRWLDDIDFGCDTYREGQKILRDIDELLLSRGLHLNSSKTKILTREEAFEHFQLRENRYLSALQKRIKARISSKKDIIWETKKLKARYYSYKLSQKNGQWQKIIKRYFTLATLSKSNFLVKYTEDFIVDNPALRSTIFNYYIALGWTREKEDIVVRYLRIASDDEGFMRAINVLISWSPCPILPCIGRMRMVCDSIKVEEPVRFYGKIKLMTKYLKSSELASFVTKNVGIWKSNEWLARQVSCLLPIIKDKGALQTISNVINSFGLTYSKLVIDNYSLISTNQSIVKNKVKPYILALIKYNIYPLHKLLISLCILNGDISLKMRNEILDELLIIINDPIYRFVLKNHLKYKR